MKEFFYFNDRLTEKLNRIRRKPFTLVCGRRTCGKSTAVYAYLANLRKKTIWHHLSVEKYDVYLLDFFRLLFAEIPELTGEITPEQLASDPMPAHALAALMKKKMSSDMCFYVLELDEETNPEIINFLYDLACQRIPQFFSIVITGHLEKEVRARGLNDKVNLIEEEDFIFTPQDIIASYRTVGIEVLPEEAVLLYDCSHGWVPLVRELAENMSENGKQKTWDRMEEIKNTWQKMYEESFTGKHKNKTGPQADMRSESLVNGADIEWKKKIWESFLAIDPDKARELLIRRKQECRQKGIRDESISVVEMWYRAFCGYAAEAYADLKQELFSRCSGGRYAGSDSLIEWSLLLYLYMYDVKGEAIYEKMLEKFSAENRNDVFTIAFNGLYLMRNGDMQRLKITMDMFGERKLSEEIILQQAFMAVACQELGESKQAEECLNKALNKAEKMNCFLPFVYMYDRLYSLLRVSDDEKTKEFVEKIREHVNAFRRQMRKNTEKRQTEYGTALTQRQTEIAALVAEHLSNKEIAALLNISENTVKTTLKTIYRKMGVEKRRELYDKLGSITRETNE